MQRALRPLAFGVQVDERVLRVTNQDVRSALIVAHGQPSDPGPAEAALADLGKAVAQHLPGWSIATATLATPGALDRAVAQAPGALIYPMFMAAGWFTKVHLPDRLRAAGAKGWRGLDPFGLDPRVQELTVALAHEAAGPRNVDGHKPEILLAAHGSFRSPAPSDVALAMAERLRQSGFDRVTTGFIDQSPRLADVARGLSSTAICLPFFAAGGGHVTEDLPAALEEAGFSGRVLPPVGLDRRVPGLIAASLRQTSDHPTL